MKIRLNISAVIVGTLAIIGLATGCNDKLVESPYTSFTTEYLKTAEGLQNGINAAYSGLRYDFGPNGALAIGNVGTDEWTYGDQPVSGSDAGVLQLGSYAISTADGSILTPWNRNYWHINVCNAILQYAPGVDMATAAKTTLMAEARYLRAQYYLLLVEQFGAVPLDLGAGELQFNTNPTSVFARLPVDEVLVKDYKAMIADLIYASQNLPDKRPAAAFKLSKAAALHLLAKVYLFRGYSAAKVSADFDSSYYYAKLLIDNKAIYGVDLLLNYGDVHKAGNDYNQEVLFSVERLTQNNSANEVPSPGTDFANKVNIANNMFNCNYQQPTYTASGTSYAYFDSRPLEYGRPLRRYCPTPWLLGTAFADRINDSRFDNTFRTVWLAASSNAAGTSAYTSYVANIAKNNMVIGDTAIFLAPTKAFADSIRAFTGTRKKKYAIYDPTQFYLPSNKAIQVYPNLKKYDDPNRANYNDVSGRPFIVSKFSETYLLAAEAALQAGHPADAVPLINTIRERAAYRTTLSASQLLARKANMDISVSSVTLDFILDERTRELCGESQRWPDLAVRGKLVERVKAYNAEGTANIKAFHMLRPIPQSELDAISDPDKTKYQNPGY